MNHIVLLTGGTGSRMHSNRPKQLIELLGRPLLLHSLETLLRTSNIGEVVVVSHPDYLAEVSRVINSRPSDSVSAAEGPRIRIVPGGVTRHESSRNGVRILAETVQGTDLILIHDGARPLITSSEVELLVQVAESFDCTSLGTPATETMAVLGQKGEVASIPARSNLYAIKTPQALRGSLKDLFLDSPAADYTDLLSWAIEAGLSAGIARASSRNVKVTNPEDLAFVASLLSDE